jgi:hypothetical protein
MTKRWIMIAACTMAALLGACGDGSETSTEGDALTLVQGAGAAVLAEETARMEVVLDVAGQSLHMDGQIDFVKQQADFGMDIPGFGPVEMVQDGATLFVRKTGPWVAVDLQGAAAEQALGATGADPRAMLDQLSKVASVQEVGEDEIRGVSVTHFRGDLDLESAMRAQGAPQEQIDAFQEQVAQLDEEVTAVLDVFIDESGLAHRTVMNMSAGAAFEMSMTMDLLDFGTPVDITVPAPADVRERRTASTQFELQQITQELLATL